MKKVLTLSIILTVICTLSISAQIQHFTWQNRDREFIIRMPAEHEGSVPVIFFLHGLGDNITRCDQEFNFSQLANDYGWAIVSPQAINQGVGAMWNAALMSSSIDDSGFLMALLDSLTVQYQLDPDSVFFTGFSMGGFMTHRMAIEHGDRITACAPVSGLITNAMAAQTPSVPVRMLHIHGTNDNVVGYDGSSSTFYMTLGLGVEDILQYWQTANGCYGEPDIDTLPDLQNDGLRFVRYTYNCGTELQHLKVLGGTHSWYNSDREYDIGYKTFIYNFFKGNDSYTGFNDLEMKRFKLWPNPTSGPLFIEADQYTTVTVMDAQGHVVAQHELQPGTSQLDLQHLPDGVYFVKEDNGAVTKVIVGR